MCNCFHVLHETFKNVYISLYQVCIHIYYSPLNNMEYLPLPSALNFSPLIRYESHLVFHTPWSYTILLLSGFDYVTHMPPLGFWCACIVQYQGQGPETPGVSLPLPAIRPFFLKPPPLEGGRVCSGGGTVLACQPAGIYIHERARVSARARAWSYYTACPARDDGEKLEQYSSEREEEAHTHKSSSRKTSTKFRRAVYYFFRETTQNFRILLINQNIQIKNI